MLRRPNCINLSHLALFLLHLTTLPKNISSHPSHGKYTVFSPISSENRRFLPSSFVNFPETTRQSTSLVKEYKTSDKSMTFAEAEAWAKIFPIMDSTSSSLITDLSELLPVFLHPYKRIRAGLRAGRLAQAWSWLRSTSRAATGTWPRRSSMSGPCCCDRAWRERLPMRGSRGGHGGCPREVVSRDGSSGAVGRVDDIIACGRWPSLMGRVVHKGLVKSGAIVHKGLVGWVQCGAAHKGPVKLGCYEAKCNIRKGPVKEGTVWCIKGQEAEVKRLGAVAHKRLGDRHAMMPRICYGHDESKND
ncbi:hypothetical protein MUK42_10078 [Musa troglodytarum]|uniref:Uncharacterized protein n=1 Tax=Musa troglodytarum TaxID=320322 RepID=A0A9E7JAY5_9LILI|nr:hypothetical protein MUK42_10078 [Musa troglodytarum]